MPKWELFRKFPFWRFKLSTLCRQLEGDGGVPAGCGRTHLPLPAPDTAGGCRRPSPSLRHTDVSHPPAGTSIARPGIPAGAMQADGQWPSLRRDLRFRVGAGVLDGPFLPFTESCAPAALSHQGSQGEDPQVLLIDGGKLLHRQRVHAPAHLHGVARAPGLLQKPVLVAG